MPIFLGGHVYIQHQWRKLDTSRHVTVVIEQEINPELLTSGTRNLPAIDGRTTGGRVSLNWLLHTLAAHNLHPGTQCLPSLYVGFFSY